jgi:threonine dehydrogenase-like Zn-dependent dehydrogenase
VVNRDSMQVLQIVDVEQFELIEMPVPEPGEGEVLIKRLGVVTCNAYDLHIYTGKPYPDETASIEFPYRPGGPGHEWAGVVAALGPGVAQLQVGDWVSIPGGRGSGRGVYPGAYAPYSVCNETRLMAVPRDMEVAKLAPLEMATCVASTILDLVAMGAIEGKKAGVSGLGPAGLIAAQMLRAEGAAGVVGLDIDRGRREYAVSAEIVDRAVDPLGEDGRSLPYRRDPGVAIETGVDCAGAPAAIEYLMDHTRDVVSLFAVQHGPVEYRGWSLGHHQGLKLCGYPNRDPACGDYTVSKIANGDIDLSLTVSHTMRLEQYGEALELIKNREALKVLFTFDQRDW